MQTLLLEIEKFKASIRSKELVKNQAQLFSLFGQVNLVLAT